MSRSCRLVYLFPLIATLALLAPSSSAVAGNSLTGSPAPALGPGDDGGAKQTLVASVPWSPATGAIRAQTGKPKKSPVYTTPGYKPSTRPVTATPVDPTTRPAIRISAAALQPRVLLDAAGTAHITWIERGTTVEGDIEVYCRLPRAADRCDALHRWPESIAGDGLGRTNIHGVQPLALNDDLALVASRYPYDGVAIPGRPPSGGEHEDATATFLDLSVDGGQTFAPRTWIGDMPIADAATYGPSATPSIVGITDTVTGGTSIQTFTGGQTTVKTALVGPGDQAYGGRVANDGGGPLATWSDLSSGGYLGRWTGQGNPNELANWRTAPIGPSAEPSLATGPAGPLLLSRPGISGAPQLRRINDLAVGAPVQAAALDFFDVEQGSDGTVYVGGVESGARGRYLLQRGSADALSSPLPIATAPAGQALGDSRFAVHGDGGGVVVSTGSGGVYNPLYVTSFGTLAPTGQPGLGQRPGGGVVGPPAVVECGRIAFGAVELRTQDGCFFTAPTASKSSLATRTQTGGLRVSTGPVDLNGVWLRPEPGVQIQIDPAAKTIDTTGAISVQLDVGGGPITVWRGELHLRLPKPNERTLLASFDTSVFPAALKGFPISGKIDMELTDKGVRIPVNLDLPKVFGGVKGEAVLYAQVGTGLRLDSLKIEIDEAFLAGPTLRNAVLSYSAGDDAKGVPSEWDGAAELVMPPGRGSLAFTAHVRFVGGKFREANLEVKIPYPGLPLFKGVYLSKVRGGFGLDPAKISVGASVGVIPVVAGDTYLVNAGADVSITFGDPWRVEMTGSANLLDFIPVANLRMILDGRGYFLFDGRVGLTVGDTDFGVGLESRITVAFDLEKELFSGRFLGGKVVVYFPDPVPDPSVTVGDVVISSRGIGLCVANGGFRYRYAGKDLTLFPPVFGACELGPIEIVLDPPAARAIRAKAARAPKASRQQAGAAPVRLDGGKFAFLHVRGAGGSPNVALIDPTGRRIDPVRPADMAQLKAAKVSALQGGGQTIISIRNPRKGNWQVVPLDGSPAITGIKRTEAEPAPRLKTRVERRGGRFALRYELRGGSKLGATIREEIRGGAGRVLGEIKSGKGTLMIDPGDGPAGRRLLKAELTRDGLPVDHAPAGRYVAPPPPRPGKAGKVTIKRVKGGVRVRWRRPANADAQVLLLTSGDGLARRITLGAKANSYTLKGVIDADDRARVSIQGVRASGRRGPTVRASLPAPKPKKSSGKKK